MKRQILFFILFLSSCLYSHSFSPKDCLVEWRVSYLYPTSLTFREIFPGSRVNYQLSAAIPIHFNENVCPRRINLWAAVDYFSKDGSSVPLQNKTNIRMVPITLGLKYFFPPMGTKYPVNFYAAAGMKYYFVHTRTHTNFVQQTINQNGMGGVIEAGFIVKLINHLFLDFFACYSIKSFDAPNISAPSSEGATFDVSNINIGGAIGYKF